MDPREWRGFRFMALAAWEVWQGYLTPSDADPEVRVRMVREITVGSAGGDGAPQPLLDAEGRETVLWRLAVKKLIATDTSGALSRHEIEPTIEEQDFAQAWRLCEGRRLRKQRVEYLVDLPGGHRPIVVDRFRDHLTGLVLAEIEFDDWKLSTEFEPPGFLGTEVTHDERYRNAALAAALEPPSN